MTRGQTIYPRWYGCEGCNVQVRAHSFAQFARVRDAHGYECGWKAVQARNGGVLVTAPWWSSLKPRYLDCTCSYAEWHGVSVLESRDDNCPEHQELTA